MIAITLFLFSLWRASSLRGATQVVQKMRCVHVAGDKLRSVAHDFRQNIFAASIDECHVLQFNETSGCVRAALSMLTSTQWPIVRPTDPAETISAHRANP
jgi:hypothetical protein